MPSNNVRLAPPGSALEARVAALEVAMRKVGALADGALQIGPNQRSIVPGELIAGRITTPLPPNQPHMTLDLIQTGAGLGPIATVSDGKYNRAQMGNLADYSGPNGVDSPAQYGFRAIDVNGNAIFDSLGLISVLSQPGGSTHGATGQQFSGGGTYSTMTASVININPTRQTTYLVIGDMQGSTAGTPGGAGATIGVDGGGVVGNPTPGSSATQLAWGAGTALVQGAMFWIGTLLAGPHNIEIQCFGSGSVTLSIAAFDLWALQIGF